MSKLSKFPGSKSIANLPTVVIMCFALCTVVVVGFRLEYSRLILTVGAFIFPLALLIQYKLLKRNAHGHYAIIPFGFYEELLKDKKNNYTVLATPGLGVDENTYDGILMDPHNELPSHWQQFLAEAIANRIPIYNTFSVYESIFGKTPLDNIPELSRGELNEPELYSIIKRILESTLIISSSPVWLPLISIFAIAIKLESKGPMFFIQRRVGQSGKEFNMIKLRSMCQDSEINGAQFAGKSDPRITRIGAIIRKVRIDEIPQFFNVIKGDMALIGPRPEQATFVKEFETKIPLYSYRHVVKPGITGWAQVTHGYADDEDSTREKLAHDFYYVKNLSLWLDIDVIIKTIQTMLNGFGAR